jgi:putative inorganic carbon (hco3(-)) transporter
MTASALELIGMLLACGAAAAALLVSDPRLRYVAIAVALIAAPALVAGDVWHSSRLVDLRDHPAKLAAAIVVAAAAIAVAGAVFRRWSWAFPVSVFATLPLRVPVQVGGQTSHLLVPLYLVIAGGFVCFAYGVLRACVRGEEDWSAGADGAASARGSPAVVWLCRVLAASLVLYAIQTAYSSDVSNAIENAAFFLVPFAVMFVLLGEVRWTPRLLGWILVVLAGLGLAFAAVAFWEYAARDLLLNRGGLLPANQLHLYFRVNSIFFDPNVFGRYMALFLVALGAYLAWARVAREAILAALAAGVLLAALALTYSMTSFAALVAGLLVVVALRWSLRLALGAGAVIAVCGVIFLLAGGIAKTDFSSGNRVDVFVSGREGLVKGGAELAEDRPVWGYGSGSFGAAFCEKIHCGTTTASHSEPITVAAEQGGIGLIVYGALVVLALIVMLSGAGASVGTTAAAACFVALLVHTIGYAGFTIDPATWALLGVGIALRRPWPEPVASVTPDSVGDPGASPPGDPRPAAV